jgi:hypothetical protein
VSARYRLGVDVGGTHTDLVLLDSASGDLLVEKVASTPNNPADGVLAGVARFIARGIPPAEIGFFSHGTTITTNALLEMRGAKVGLLITKGFRAVQEVQNQARDGNLFEYFHAKPPPIAPQSLTREIPERCDYAGNVLLALDETAVRQAARALKAAGVESVAVCYLFSFMNPAHEQQTRALLREECPGIHVSLSSEVLPRIREWPRLSTTLHNAYLEPVMVSYVADLNAGLDAAGLRTRQRFLMQSNGGVMPFSAAIAGGRTVHTLFSGPAAGAQASAYLAREDARIGLITLDMAHQRRLSTIEGGASLGDRNGDRPAPDGCPRARHDHDLRGRLDRLDRRRRLPQCRPAERGRRSRACVLRTRRHAADGDRCRSCLRLSQSGLFSGRCAETRRRSVARGARDAHCRAAEDGRADGSGGDPTHRRHAHGHAVRVFAPSGAWTFGVHAVAVQRSRAHTAVASELGVRRIPFHRNPRILGAWPPLYRCGARLHAFELRPLAEISAAHAEQIFRAGKKGAPSSGRGHGLTRGQPRAARLPAARAMSCAYRRGLARGEIAPARSLQYGSVSIPAMPSCMGMRPKSGRWKW